jgi:hypothetical protein
VHNLRETAVTVFVKADVIEATTAGEVAAVVAYEGGLQQPRSSIRREIRSRRERRRSRRYAIGRVFWIARRAAEPVPFEIRNNRPQLVLAMIELDSKSIM